jgi:hypothetical protein
MSSKASWNCGLRKSFLAASVAIQVVNFLVLYVVLPQQMFSRHLDPMPLTEPLAGKLTEGRIVSAGLDDRFAGEKILPGFSAALLGYDYATLWGFYHFGGYDPMVSEKAQQAALGIKNNPVFNLPADEPFAVPEETLEYFRKWGVRWYVVSSAIPLASDAPFRLFSSDGNRNVLLDQAAKPLVYWAGDSKGAAPVEFRFTENSVKVEYDSTANGTIIVNALYHPYFSARLDGQPLPVTETADSQMALAVPGGKHRLEVAYGDRDFRRGALAAAVAILLLAAGLARKGVRAAIVRLMS